MKQMKYTTILSLTILLLASAVQGETHYKSAIDPNTPMYFGHISFVEDNNEGVAPVVIREGSAKEEIAVVNFPLTPGDTIRTGADRRCEIQFDTGTIIRLDYDTELKIETVLANSLSTRKKITTLILQRGQIYHMYTQYKAFELFQVLTPDSAVKLNNRAIGMIGISENGTAISVKSGKSNIMFGQGPDHTKQRSVKKMKSLLVSSNNQVSDMTFKLDSEFYLWNEGVNENFRGLHDGISAVPKPVLRYSPAIRYFAQRYSSVYGEWIWNDYAGYVWRPYYNDLYPWGNWSPYHHGRWRQIDDQMFWVPNESWGWVPYHLGVWIWSKSKGWLWMPGSAFSGAWVTWGQFAGHYSWRPWGFMDWLGWDWYYFNGNFYSHWMRMGLFGENPSLVDGSEGHFPYTDFFAGEYTEGSNIPNLDKPGKKSPISKIIKNKLKQAKNGPLLVPKEMKQALKNYAKMLVSNPNLLRDSIMQQPRSTVIVRREDINSDRIGTKAIPFNMLTEGLKTSFFRGNEGRLPQIDARNTYQKIDSIHQFNMRILQLVPPNMLPIEFGINRDSEADPAHRPALRERGAGRSPGLLESTSRLEDTATQSGTIKAILQGPASSIRHRDWNPDIGIAQRAGVTITYHSRTNEIRCPELNLSSLRVGPLRNLASRTGYKAFGSTSYSSSGTAVSGGGSAGGGSVSGGGTATGTRGTSSSRSSGSSSRAGTTKK
ncbi:DUF6600 domain-containing protein [Acidobacteriota bacterium]